METIQHGPCGIASETARVSALLGISIDQDTLTACEYLELNGYRYLVHFGHGNAKSIAANVARRKLCGKPPVKYPAELYEWWGE